MHEKLSQIVRTPKGEGRVVGYDEAGRYFVALNLGTTKFFDRSEVIFPTKKTEPKPTEEQIYTTALSKFGHPAQINKMVEECAELITALCHHRISRAADDEVCSELADVEIMLAQMRLVFGAENVEREKGKKLARLAERTGLKLAMYGVCGG